jgi:hypothetical protein
LTEMKGKRPARWLRWVLYAGMTAAVLLIAGFGYAYYSIKSIDVEDVIARQEAGGEDTPPASPALSGAIEKASKLSGQEVKPQDALDVAAILLNSGLSLREINFLLGTSDNRLSVEEKQHIRDLLLAKLTEEEIKALRAITTKYGKGLIILDPEYPIELVGVYDPEERERIKQELASKKQPDPDPKKEQAEDVVVADPASKPLNDPTKGDERAVAPPQKEAEPPVVQETPNAKAQKAEILTVYRKKLDTLQASCTAQVDRFGAEVVAAVKQAKADKKPLSAKLIDESLRGRLASAEEQCDRRFQSLVAGAEKELKEQQLNGKAEMAEWKRRYEQKKKEERTAVLVQLAPYL